MSIHAIIANAVCVGPISHTPLRLTPPRIAIEESKREAGTTGCAGCGRGAGASAARGAGQVGGDRHQVAVRLGGVRRLEPLVELLEVDPALGGGVAQHVGDAVPVVVGDPQPRRVGALQLVPPCTASLTMGTNLLAVNSGPEFRYSDLLPTGADDTPYRLVTTEGVSAFEAAAAPSSRCSPRRSGALTEEAMHDIAHYLRPAHLAQLRRIIDDPEASGNDRFVALDLLKNVNISAAACCRSARTPGPPS